MPFPHAVTAFFLFSQDNRSAILNHVESALKRMQAFLESEVDRDADGSMGVPDRKQREGAIEQLLSARASGQVSAGVPTP